MTDPNGLQNPLQRCTDCRAPNPQMNNCNKQGERIDGFICVNCWKSKHPVMQRDHVRMFHPVTVRLFIVLAFYNVAAIAFMLWERFYK